MTVIAANVATVEQAYGKNNHNDAIVLHISNHSSRYYVRFITQEILNSEQHNCKCIDTLK